MTTAASDASAVFADARFMHDASLERLAAGDIRDAAEKAWCAAKRAMDALILARTGELPARSPLTTRALRELAKSDPAVRNLRRRYFDRQRELHGRCFYTGQCEPLDGIEDVIRQTADYIADAERLADA